MEATARRTKTKKLRLAPPSSPCLAETGHGLTVESLWLVPRTGPLANNPPQRIIASGGWLEKHAGVGAVEDIRSFRACGCGRAALNAPAGANSHFGRAFNEKMVRSKSQMIYHLAFDNN
jgi:hypothetical protein